MNKIPLFGVVHLPEMEAAAVAILRSRKIASGEYVARFESGLGEIIGRRHVVSTVDMTSAINLALRLSEVNLGDEVMTTAFACMATNSAIAQCGAVPVWVDLEAGSVQMSVSDFLAKVSIRTKAVILYHAAGYVGPAREIAAHCRERGIRLIEDCDNALFAQDGDAHVGSHGDFAVYSFYPNRQVNTTEGGALVCRSEADAERARKLRRFGINAPSFRNALGEIDPNADIAEIGWSYTMNNLCAALGCAQFPTAETRAEQTRHNAATLAGLLDAVPGVHLIAAAAGTVPAYWTLLTFVDDRDNVIRAMAEHGIHTSAMHQRNDVYSGFGTSVPAQLEHTSYVQGHLLALPCGWWLSEPELRYIADTLRVVVNGSAAR